MSLKTRIALIGTCDTKLQELLYLRSQILARSNTEVVLIDIGRAPTQHDVITISRSDLLSRYNDGSETPEDIFSLPRNEVLELMSNLASVCIARLHASHEIHGIISAGGSGGTSVAAAVMRKALPVGFPKLIVSTVASGDTGPIVGETDITLMYSVVDISGLNSLFKTVLSNAAGAIVGMAQCQASRDACSTEEREVMKKKTRIGMTMFGVTTPCVDMARERLSDTLGSENVEIYIFHATGHGGLAMERLIDEGNIDAVLDISTTEICDHLAGGSMSAGPSRLNAALKKGIPNIISFGATDMVNFGPRDTAVPQKYKNRNLLVHNANVTLMRTSKGEGEGVGKFIVDKVKSHLNEKDMVQIWIPKGGVSVLDKVEGLFHDREADDAMFDVVRSGLQETGVKIVERDDNINDEKFAVAIADELIRMIRSKEGGSKVV